MKNILLIFASFYCFNLHAQYYYNDIIGTQETNRQMKAFVDSKVKSVTATGIEPQGVKSSDFNEWQELSDDNLMLKITTRNGQSVNKVYYRFDNQSRLISTTDSSGYVQNTSRFTYDTNGRISIVENTIKDSANDFNQVEIHRWTFDPDGKPVSMWRTINNSDSMEIRYVADEEGNPGEEHSYKRGVETGVLYYYFDHKNRLTDIVRFNKKANRLLPDYMFEYDENDRVIQKITTLSNIDLGYIIWRYLFDEKGLKTKEALFDKNKQQTGRIEYSYTFRD